MQLTYWRCSAKAQSELDSAFQRCFSLPDAKTTFLASPSLNAWHLQEIDGRH